MKIKLPKLNLKGMSVKKGLHLVKAFTTENAPELAAAGAILALGATVFITVKCTKKHTEELKAKEEEKKQNATEVESSEDDTTDGNTEAKKEESTELTKVEKAKIIAKCYWPVAVSVGVSAGLMIASVKFSQKQLKAAMVAATMAETALANKDGAIAKILGSKQQAELIKEENKAELEERKAPTNTDIIERSTLAGESLFYETLTKRYFYSDIDLIKSAIIECKEEMLDCGGQTVNDYLLKLGIDTIECGDEIGWEFDRCGNIKCDLEYDANVNGRPTILIKHKTLPQALISASHFGTKW